MGACPSAPLSLTLGCLTGTGLRLDHCHERGVGEAAEAIEAGTTCRAADGTADGGGARGAVAQDTPEKQPRFLLEATVHPAHGGPEAQQTNAQGIFVRQSSGASPRQDALSMEDDSALGLALAQNQDFAAELRGLSPEAVRARLDRIVQDMRCELEAGTNMLLGRQRVTLAFDPALQCLDIREHGSLYPLAALGECSQIPRRGDGALEVLAQFYNSEALLFRFHRGQDRAAFVLTLYALAAEARKVDKWHEDWGEGWEDETHDEGWDGGSPETESTSSSGAGAALPTEEQPQNWWSPGSVIGIALGSAIGSAQGPERSPPASSTVRNS